MPSLLGRAGGVALLRVGETAADEATARAAVEAAAAATTGFERTLGLAWAGDGEVITGREGSRAGLDGESSSSRFFLNFWDDFRGGGLGGGGESRLSFF